MTRSSGFWFFLVVLLLAATVATMESFPPAQAASDEKAAAIYTHGVLHVTIPYRVPHAGAGRLTVEVLNPEDQVLGRVEQQVDAGKTGGAWKAGLKLTKELSIEDLAWHRLRYRFAFANAKEAVIAQTDSISQILRLPVLHILGQQSYLTGGTAAVRVIVADSKNEPIPGPASVRIELLPTAKPPVMLYNGPLDSRGTTEAKFRFPAGLAGRNQLRYVVDTPIGSNEFKQDIRLEDKISILLTTEKPIYQPGQTIHVRSLALDRGNHEAAAARKLTFELEDSRGNKVFKKMTQTSKFGVASAEFALADEVNMGTYHLRAVMDESQTAEIAINVDRYVLPKFKVAVDFVGQDKRTKRGYRPGDHVTGTVRANYFFGKPVDDAAITVKATAIDVAQFEAGSVEGKTDRDGAYHFDLTLPRYFAGHPLKGGLARVLIEATVKDSAGHSETRGEPVTVSASPLLLTAIPEGGAFVPNLENQIFILASYPDGKPATADVKINAVGDRGQSVTTDAGGVAVISLSARATTPTLVMEATDQEGNHASTSVQLDVRAGGDQVLLRTERAVYKAGDRIQLKVLSTKSRGSVYVDVVKEGQTVLTRDVDLVNGQAELSLTATPELAGTLDLNAYLFGADAQPVGDHHLVFVQPADELKIKATSDAPVYKPGEEAHVRFRVTNTRGEGVQAALGLQVVDEAVFALAEKQPGFAKVFFYLEQEVLKPRYEIHSTGMPEIVEGQHDRAARALFAATEIVNTNKFETEVGHTAPSIRYAEFAARYQKVFAGQLRRVSADDLAESGELKVRDAWGTTLQAVKIASAGRFTDYLVRSAGPDKQFLTADDLSAYVETRTRKTIANSSAAPISIGLTVEHGRGAFNGRGEIAGSVFDQRGGALEGAGISVREISTGKVRRATVSANGQFRLAALPAGEYEVTASSESRTISRRVILGPRDRAVLSVMLRVESAGNAVMVRELPLNGMNFGQLAGFAGGVPGGVGAGVIGGIARGDVMGIVTAAGPVVNVEAAAAMLVPMEAKALKSTITVPKDQPEPAAPRVRSYFPEALYINPEIVTDADGRASITIPMADSITTWRMAMLASTTHGALGSGTSSLKVFQDFFVDLDMPVTITQGDRVSIPVAAYNYSGTRGKVDLKLQTDDWFGLVEDVPEKSLDVDAGRVGGAQFTLEARRIGKFKLTLAANLKGVANRADIVVREVEVIPNGREQNMVFNGRLETSVQHELNFPAASISEANKILVRLYPGPLSQVIEGMDAILRMPGGCFEQTSSSTYPNVLALDYMKRTKKLTPEVHAKAEGYIANGYQRLLTFEVPGGGFSWFGSAPANKILTSYGLMEFSDMSKVHDVDPKVIQRTQQWLASQQQPDGSWKPDTSFINEGATNRYNSDLLRITAYIGWALENTGYQGPAVENARQYVAKHMNAKMDSYTLAVVANFAVDSHDREFARQAVELLLDARAEKGEQVWWTPEETGVYATGASASVETTGLAVQALLKWGQASATARKALSYVSSKKDAGGTWGNTQATIMALRALLLASEKGTADVRGTLEVTLNGKPVEKLTLTPENNDLLHQFVFKQVDSKGPNQVAIKFNGNGGLAYQVVGRYFVPWTEKAVSGPLSISVSYDRAHLAQDDIASATATIKSNLPKVANMVMVDLGIPPGFDLLSEDLQSYQEKSAGQKSGRLDKFSLTATQAILYFDSVAAGDTVTVHFRLRAKYPIRARTFQSRVYEYYNPEVSSIAAPVLLEVKKR